MRVLIVVLITTENDITLLATRSAQAKPTRYHMDRERGMVSYRRNLLRRLPGSEYAKSFGGE